MGECVCEPTKWELKRRLIYEYRCDERLKTKTEESTGLVDTGLVVELEHLKIKTRLIDEKFTRVWGVSVRFRSDRCPPSWLRLIPKATVLLPSRFPISTFSPASVYARRTVILSLFCPVKLVRKTVWHKYWHCLTLSNWQTNCHGDRRKWSKVGLLRFLFLF
jgi:hypothetical protein